MRHIISLLMENESGALSRVSGLFSARGYNIESLTVAATEDPTLSRMTIVTAGSDEVIEQIIKQLNKLIDVVKVLDLNDGKFIERELMLVKVKATGAFREEMKRMCDIFRGRIIDVAAVSYTHLDVYKRQPRHQRRIPHRRTDPTGRSDRGGHRPSGR